MRIAVVGADAIGGYLGTRLAAAGNKVTFIALNILQILYEQGLMRPRSDCAIQIGIRSTTRIQ